jgi:hypothetical protein
MNINKEISKRGPKNVIRAAEKAIHKMHKLNYSKSEIGDQLQEGFGGYDGRVDAYLNKRGF